MIGRMPTATGTATAASVSNPAMTSPPTLRIECITSSGSGSTGGGKRCRRAADRTSWPIRSAVPSEDGANPHDNRHEGGLEPPWCEQHRLGLSMSPGEVSQVEERRTVRWTAVEHVERGLEVHVEIDDRFNDALEHEHVVAVVPPSMRGAHRQRRRAAR